MKNLIANLKRNLLLKINPLLLGKKLKRIREDILHVHEWIEIAVYSNKDRLYRHEKYKCKSCNKQMHIVRHWDRIPKISITDIYDSNKYDTSK